MEKIVAVFLLFNLAFSNGIISQKVFACEKNYSCYSNIFFWNDKYENINHKIFVKNIHILWASIFPNFIIDSINRTYNNIEYPKRLVNSLLQRDLDGAKYETKRFLINPTLGIAGLFNIAYKIFHLESYEENIEQYFSQS